jgi:hypothetical protein
VYKLAGRNTKTVDTKLRRLQLRSTIQRQEINNTHTPEDKRHSLPNILSRMGEEEHMALEPRQKPSKTTLKLDLNFKVTRNNVPPLMILEESARRRHGLDRLRQYTEPSVFHVVHILCPGSAILGQRPPPSAHHHPRLRMPHRSILDSLDDVFKKIMTPWSRRRGSSEPDVGFPSA